MNELLGILSMLVRDNSRFLSLLSLFMVLDIFSGILASLIRASFTTSALRKGLLVKTLDLAAVMLLLAFFSVLHFAGGPVAGPPLDIRSFPARKIMIWCFMVKECLSIIENYKLAGGKLPSFLAYMLGAKKKPELPEDCKTHPC